MPSIQNKYINGLNQDLAINKQGNDSLSHALNINLIANDKGEASCIIENHKGNSLSFKLPTLNPKYKLSITGNLIGMSYSILTSTGVITSTFPSITSVQELKNFLETTYSSIFPWQIQLFINSNNELIIQQNTTHIFSIITPPGNTYVRTVIVPLQTNLTPIGWGQLGEDLILFTCPSTQDIEDPNNANVTYYGQIWKIDYNQSDGTVGNLTPAGFLDSYYHLVYNDVLNFSLANPIYKEVIGRVEASNIGNVYWTDNYNKPRVANVYNPNLQALDPKLIDWLPDSVSEEAKLQSISSGGNLPVGTIQVAYQYITFDGAASNFSPLSNPVNLTDSSFTEPFQDFQGAEVGTNSGKSLQYTISNIDTRYNYIRVVAVMYELEDVPSAFVIDEIPINGNNASFTVNTLVGKSPITIAEIINSQVPFDTVKTFTEKKNRLYPANVTSEKRKLNFDARAYRFNNFGDYRLYSRDGTFITGSGLDSQLVNLPETHDAVNPYNDESGTIYGLFPTSNIPAGYNTWINNYQYKYQDNGVVLGGTGPNVSYEFTVESYEGDAYHFDIYGDYVGTYTAQHAPFIKVDPISGTIDGYNVTSPYNSIKSPLQSFICKTHARGEVYRYGIVGFDAKGNSTFVEWIADIKIPESFDNITMYCSTVDNTGVLKLNYIGIKFTINTAKLYNDNPWLQGFQIVACPRKDTDKTRLSMGTVLAPSAELKNIDNFDRYNISVAGIMPSGTSNPQNECIPTLVLGNYFWQDDSSNDDHPFRHLNWGFNKNVSFPFGSTNQSWLRPSANVDNTINYSNLAFYKSPDVDFNPAYTSDFYFKEIEWYKTIDDADPNDFIGVNTPGGVVPHAMADLFDGKSFTQGKRYWQKSTTTLNDNYSRGIYYMFRDASLAQIPSNEAIRPVLKSQLLGIDSFVPASFSPQLQGLDYSHIIKCEKTGPNLNVDTNPSLSGIGSKGLFCEIMDGNGFNKNGGDVDYITVFPSGRQKPAPYKKLVAQCRFNFAQYGGPWRSNRYYNIYTPKSKIYNNVSSQNLTTENIPGDIFMVYYDCVLNAMHWSNNDVVDSNSYAENRGLGTRYSTRTNTANNMLATALVFPCESSVNTELRHGKHWARNQVMTNDGDEFSQFMFDEFTYNEAYSQENNLKTYISEPYDSNFVEEYPYHIYASKPKLDNSITDSWRIYPINDFLQVEGTFGPINRIVNWTEKVISYQDRAVSHISTEERGTVQDETGAIIQTGTGAVLSRYDYISKETGSMHQFSVIVSPTGVYHVDARLKKIFKFSEGLLPLGEIKGMSTYLRQNIIDNVLAEDSPLIGSSIHGEYDPLYNKVYFTLRSHAKPDKLTEFTLSYNEIIERFESFYSFKPKMYISLGRRLLSTNPFINNEVYVHGTGDYGRFYGQLYDSEFSFIVNADPSSLLTFRTDYVRFWTQVTDLNNNDVWNETMSTIKFDNDYQTTNLMTLVPGSPNSLVKRFERGWSVNMIRDKTDVNKYLLPYLRDKFVRITGTYNNLNNNRFRLHDFNTFITTSYPYEK